MHNTTKIGMAALFCAVLGQAARAQEPQASAQQPSAPGAVTLAIQDNTFDPAQPIRANFAVSISVVSSGGPEKDLSGNFLIDPSGAVQLNMVGRVDLKGLTPAQAAERLTGLVKPYIKDPRVSVAILSVPKPIIFLSGALNRTGAVPINDNTTLGEVVTVFGFNESADLSRVRVMHAGDGGRSTREYDFLKWMRPAPGQKPDETQDPVLTDRDMVYIPLKTAVSTGTISVEGDVTKPATVPLRYGVSTHLREAISMAGGINTTADHHLAVRRMGVEQPIPVDYDKMEAGDPKNDIVLQPEDIVYVPKLASDKFILVSGGFGKPGKIALDRPMTLTEAVAQAGGLTLGAKEKDGSVYRHLPSDPTKTQRIAFNYKDIRTGKKPDIALQAGDTIEIPQGSPPRQGADMLQTGLSILSVFALLHR